MTRTLEIMARMRHLAVEEARQHLAICIQAESAAQQALRDAADAVAREFAAATAPDTTDELVEAYAAWLPVGIARRTQATRQFDNAVALTLQARAQLNAARAGTEAVDRRIATLATAERDSLLAKEQATLDEAALTNWPPPAA